MKRNASPIVPQASPLVEFVHSTYELLGEGTATFPFGQGRAEKTEEER